MDEQRSSASWELRRSHEQEIQTLQSLSKTQMKDWIAHHHLRRAKITRACALKLRQSEKAHQKSQSKSQREFLQQQCEYDAKVQQLRHEHVPRAVHEASVVEAAREKSLVEAQHRVQIQELNERLDEMQQQLLHEHQKTSKHQAQLQEKWSQRLRQEKLEFDRNLTSSQQELEGGKHLHRDLKRRFEAQSCEFQQALRYLADCRAQQQKTERDYTATINALKYKKLNPTKQHCRELEQQVLDLQNHVERMEKQQCEMQIQFQLTNVQRQYEFQQRLQSFEFQITSYQREGQTLELQVEHLRCENQKLVQEQQEHKILEVELQAQLKQHQSSSTIEGKSIHEWKVMADLAQRQIQERDKQLKEQQERVANLTNVVAYDDNDDRESLSLYRSPQRRQRSSRFQLFD